MDLLQQRFADLVLHKEMRETVQYTTILPTVPLEEHLFRTEDARYTIHRNMSVFQDMQIVIPELVLNEESHHRTDGTQETTGIGDRIQRQVADNVRTFVVLTYLITRG